METGYRCRNKGISSLILLVTFLMLMLSAGLASGQYPDDAQIYFDRRRAGAATPPPTTQPMAPP